MFNFSNIYSLSIFCLRQYYKTKSTILKHVNNVCDKVIGKDTVFSMYMYDIKHLKKSKMYQLNLFQLLYSKYIKRDISNKPYILNFDCKWIPYSHHHIKNCPSHKYHGNIWVVKDVFGRMKLFRCYKNETAPTLVPMTDDLNYVSFGSMNITPFIHRFIYDDDLKFLESEDPVSKNDEDNKYKNPEKMRVEYAHLTVRELLGVFYIDLKSNVFWNLYSLIRFTDNLFNYGVSVITFNDMMEEKEYKENEIVT